MARPSTPEDRLTAVSDALYRALVRYDREDRSMRAMRSAMGGRGPVIVRGTKRSALVRYLALEAIRALEDDGWGPDV